MRYGGLPDPLEAWTAVVSSLQTLETIERGSLMSRKGRQCLQRFLHVLEPFDMFCLTFSSRIAC